ncbi:MAG: LysE family transporter [Bacteroidales bacterium]
MFSSIFFQGLIIGILVSIPMGPIGVLCVQRTLHQGKKAGLISGIGAATADSFFATIAGFGLTFISSFFIDNKFAITLLGAIVLIVLGVRLFITNTIKQVRKYKTKKMNVFSDFFSVFFLTLSNPITIIFFGVVFAGLGIVKNDTSSLSILIIGIFFGAIVWWFVLSSLVNQFRQYFRLRIIFYINKFAGVLIVLFGLFALANAFYPNMIQKETLQPSHIVDFTDNNQPVQDTIK